MYIYFDNKIVGYINDYPNEKIGHTDYPEFCQQDPVYDKTDNKTFLADGSVEYGRDCVESELIRIAMKAKEAGRL